MTRTRLKSALRHLRRGALHEARIDLDEISSTVSSDAEVQILRAVATSDAAAARRDLTSALALPASGKKFQERVVDTLQRLGILVHVGDLLLEGQDALDARGHVFHACVAERLGRYREAQRSLDVIGGELGVAKRSLPALSEAERLCWLGRFEAARAAATAEHALSASPRALRVRGVCALLLGEAHAARDDLTQANDLDPHDGETMIWLGELAFRSGDLDRALELIDAGIAAVDGYPLGAHVSRLYVSIRGAPGELVGVEDCGELLGMLRPLVGGDAPEGPDVHETVVLPLLESALRAFAGNRSARPTIARDGELVAFEVAHHSRFASRDLQELLRVKPASYVVERLRALAGERPDAHTVSCHVGEVHLWTGDYAAARCAFEEVLAKSPRVRWAYIGLAAAHLMDGDLDEALAACARGIRVAPPPGRTMFAYRGEAYRRRGDMQRARDDLVLSLRQTPERISAWINMALIDGDASACVARLRRRAPGLVGDARCEVPDAAAARLLEHVLVMMRGNRSSSFVTYFTAAGHMRFVPPLTS